ncbi:MAG: hypothetical protein LC670_00515 [Flavobacteriales bacterium]|nr:hypothetical protein [Flavobacteriales bacterium]
MAFSSLVIFFLFIPGVLFRRFYFTEEFSKQYFKPSFSELLLSSFFPGLFIHAFLLALVVYPLGYKIDYYIFGLILLGNSEAQLIQEIASNVDHFSSEILWYFSASILLGIVLGRFTKTMIRRTMLDRKYKLFRFKNEWHYLFSGEILDFPRVSGSYEEVDFRYVDALVQTNEGVFIYNGFPEEYILSKDGGIDRIYLSDVRRRLMKEDNQEGKKERYYRLPGKFFVLPYEHIINLHIVYYSIEAELADHSSA